MTDADNKNEVINITTDGQVTKRILREGVGALPAKNASVSVHYDAYLKKSNTLFDSSREKKCEFNFTLKDGKVIEAWELAIPTMKVGEKAEIICTSDYGYGDEGRQHIVPKKADLRFELELLGFWEAAGSAAERIDRAQKKKEEGNELFKKGATEEALFAYRRARAYIKDLWNCEPDELEKSRFLIVTIQLNIAACHLKLKNYDFAIEVCKRALDRDSTNIKAYYRLGQAYLAKGEFDEAIDFVNMGLQYKPSNPELLAMKATAEQKKKKWLQDSKKIYRKMCE